VLVQRMADAGPELLLSCRYDPHYGPLVVVGLGGVWVEVLNAVRVALAPVDADRARDLIASLPGRAVLDGARGRPPADLEVLIEAMLAVSRLACDVGPALDTLEINPLIVGPRGRGALAVDVVCLTRQGGPLHA
jgi:hypothetical protein